jgi:Fe-Mn family superoxide dismutase
MAPKGEGGEPSAEFLARIEADFGSFDAMRKAFDQAGLARFGSGWVWLVFGMDGKLKITTTANQDNPLMDVVPAEERGIPLLGNDVWEHAYYLNYQNRRADYLAAWWDIVDWRVVNERYEQAAGLE